jgi:hypothetical protein
MISLFSNNTRFPFSLNIPFFVEKVKGHQPTERVFI